MYKILCTGSNNSKWCSVCGEWMHLKLTGEVKETEPLVCKRMEMNLFLMDKSNFMYIRITFLNYIHFFATFVLYFCQNQTVVISNGVILKNKMLHAVFFI